MQPSILMTAKPRARPVSTRLICRMENISVHMSQCDKWSHADVHVDELVCEMVIRYGEHTMR